MKQKLIKLLKEIENFTIKRFPYHTLKNWQNQSKGDSGQYNYTGSRCMALFRPRVALCSGHPVISFSIAMYLNLNMIITREQMLLLLQR